MRTFGRILIAALVLAVVAGAGTASARAAVPVPGDFFGVSAAGMLATDEEAVEVQLLGIHRVRLNLEWAKADPLPSGCDEAGALDWTYYDGVVRGAAEHEISLVADLYGNRPGCVPQQFPVPRSANYREYVAAPSAEAEGGFAWQAVHRYGSGGSFWAENPTVPYRPITAWEVWNEPNLPENNPFEVVQPQLYANLVIHASAAIHAADPTAQVLLGGIYSGGGMSIEEFLRTIYAFPWGYTPEQFHEAFDGVGVHPYAISGSGPTLAFGGPEVAETRLVEERRVLDQPRPALGAESDADKPLWVTEIGWPTEFAATPALAAITPEIQAAYVTAAMGWFYEHAAEYRIEYAANFVLSDYHPATGCIEPSCWPQYAGLNRLEFVPQPLPVDRPSLLAYQSLIASPPAASE